MKHSKRNDEAFEDDAGSQADEDWQEHSESTDTLTSTLDFQGFETKSTQSPFYKMVQQEIKLKNDLGYLHVRQKPFLLRYFMPAITSEDEDAHEEFYRRQLMLWKPWRDEENDLKESFGTYQDAFDSYIANCPPLRKQIIEKIIRLDKLDAEAYLERQERRQKRQERNAAAAAISDEPMDEVPVLEVTEETLSNKVQSLNNGQREVYDDVLQRLTSTEDGKKQNLFCSGVAGTGKSHLIDAISSMVQLKFGGNSTSPAVLIGAPTGLAAKNIHGATLHSLFRLEVEKQRTARHMILKALQDMKILMNNVKLVIIDEISMVSNVVLWKINLRLQEVSGNYTKPFGGIVICAFGDLMQLPPVRLPPVFVRLSSHLAKSVFQAVFISYDLWGQEFDYSELTQNMRQQDDIVYSEMLNRIRIGKMTAEDKDSIQSRLIKRELSKEQLLSGCTLDELCNYFLRLYSRDNKAVCLFGLTSFVRATNERVMEMLHTQKPDSEMIEIPAYETSASVTHFNRGSKPWLRKGSRLSDILSGITSGTFKEVNSREESAQKTKATGGLQKVLKLMMGARVMLTRNVEFGTGLVNGAMGALTDIVQDADGNVAQLRIHFDHLDRSVIVSRVQVPYQVNPKRNLVVIRSQFPVVVAYAVTIHKAQGMSLENVVVDLCVSFCEGQIYVAMSRATNLMGLHVAHFVPENVIVSVSAVHQYDVLRATIGMQPLVGESILPQKPNKKKKNDWIKLFLGERAPPVTPVFTLLKATKDARVKRVPVKKAVEKKKKKAMTKRLSKDQKQITKASIDTVPPPGTTVSITAGCLLLKNRSIQNRKTDCWLNAIVQCLRCVRYVKNLPIQESAVWQELATILHASGVHDVGSLRRVMHKESEEEDPDEEFQAMVQILPNLEQTPIMLSMTRTSTCTRCKHVGIENAVSPVYNLAPDEARLAESIKGIIENGSRRRTIRTFCSRCCAAKEECDVVVLNTFDFSTTRCFAVRIPLFDGRHRRRQEVPLPRQEEQFEIDGSVWAVRSAIIHTGSNFSGGHFTALVKEENDWRYYNDDAPPETIGRVPREYRGAYMIFVERV